MQRRSGRTRMKGFDWPLPSGSDPSVKKKLHSNCILFGGGSTHSALTSKLYTGFSMARTLDHLTAPRFYARPPESSMWIATMWNLCLLFTFEQPEVRCEDGREEYKDQSVLAHVKVHRSFVFSLYVIEHRRKENLYRGPWVWVVLGTSSAS